MISYVQGTKHSVTYGGVCGPSDDISAKASCWSHYEYEKSTVLRTSYLVYIKYCISLCQSLRSRFLFVGSKMQKNKSTGEGGQKGALGRRLWSRQTCRWVGGRVRFSIPLRNPGDAFFPIRRGETEVALESPSEAHRERALCIYLAVVAANRLM